MPLKQTFLPLAAVAALSAASPATVQAEGAAAITVITTTQQVLATSADTARKVQAQRIATPPAGESASRLFGGMALGFAAGLIVVGGIFGSVHLLTLPHRRSKTARRPQI